MRNKAVEIRAKLSRWARDSGGHPWESPLAAGDQAHELLALWGKVVTALASRVGNAGANKHTKEVMSQTRPTIDVVDHVIDIIKAADAREKNDRRKCVSVEATAQRRWDRLKNHSRCAFARVRANYSPHDDLDQGP